MIQKLFRIQKVSLVQLFSEGPAVLSLLLGLGAGIEGVPARVTE